MVNGFTGAEDCARSVASKPQKQMTAEKASLTIFFTVNPTSRSREKTLLARTEKFTPDGQTIAAEARLVFCSAYNIFVSRVQRQNDRAPEHRRHAAYATETSGLLLVAFLLLVLIVVRYWHVLHWSVR
jgi:hypothetical protein